MSEEKSKYITKRERLTGPDEASRRAPKKINIDKLPNDIKLKFDDGKVVIVTEPQKMKTGGRAGYKMGSKGCKLAMKGKGRAYGKNS